MKRGHYVTEAIILDSFDYGESDRILAFCTKGFGKVKGIAKGARRSRKRFVGRLEPGSCINLFFHYSEKSELVRVEDAALINGFAGIRGDVERFASACYLLELTGAFTRPGLEHCVSCGVVAASPERGGRLCFCPQRGGALCKGCVSELRSEKVLSLSAGTAMFIQAIERMAVEKLDRLRPGPSFMAEAGPILDSFIKIRLGHGLKTKKFMDQMNNLNPMPL